MEAAETGKTKDVAQLLSRGAKVDAKRNEPPRETALLLALSCRHDKTARGRAAILRFGRGFCYILQEDGTTTLQRMGRNGARTGREIRVVARPQAVALIDAGADCRYRCETGQGAVVMATESGCLSKNKHLLRMLVAKGANPDDRDETGFTALLAAVQRRKVGEVDQLLSFGAQPDLSNAEGSTALMCAAATGDKAICQRLIDGKCDVNKIDEYNCSARDRAKLATKDDVVELLTKNGGLEGSDIVEMSGGRVRKPLARRASQGRVRCRSFDDVERARAEMNGGILEKDPLATPDHTPKAPPRSLDPLAAASAKRRQ